MNVEQHPGIGAMEPGSLCHTLYTSLYAQFFNAQIPKSDENPYGIEEGDETSLRLKNAAYGFASAIAGAVSGSSGGSEGGILMEYLKRSGGDMTGRLGAACGFRAGEGNVTVLETFAEEVASDEGIITQVRRGVKIAGDLELGGRSLRLAGRQAVYYDDASERLSLEAPRIDFGKASLYVQGELIVGSDPQTGILLAPHLLQVAGYEVWHAGTANIPSADWTMRDAVVHGALTVQGPAAFSATFEALQGVRLGAGGHAILTLSGEAATLSGDLSFTEGCGIRIGGKAVLFRAGGMDIQVGAAGGDLLLGSDDTRQIRLLTPLTDADAEETLLTPYGHASFPGSLCARHDYGELLLATYRVDTDDEGVVLHKRLRLGSAEGFCISGDDTGLTASAKVEYTLEGVAERIPHTLRLEFRAAESRQAPQDRRTEALHLATDAFAVFVGVPLEAVRYLGIQGSVTRLADKTLYLDDTLRLQASEGGIIHAGGSIFEGDISSRRFAAGMAGYGWGIRQNGTTGAVQATFDEVVARHRIRAYEFEVSKSTASGGALWISDACSGDSVEKL